MKSINSVKEKFFIYTIISLYIFLLLSLITINLLNTNKKKDRVELGNIITQDNIVIAKNVNGYVYYLNKNLIKNHQEVENYIKKNFSICFNNINKKNNIIYLLGKKINKINEEPPKGIFILKEQFRYYPYKDIFIHPVGIYTENISFGLELYNYEINKKNKNNHNQNIITTLMFPFQYYLYKYGKEGLLKYKGEKFHGVIQNEYGEIVGMVSICRNNNNEIFTTTNNGVVNNTFEFGSIVKFFTFSLGLHKNIISLEDKFNINEGAKIGSHKITDVVANKGTMSVRDIFKYSSNIGTIKIAEKLLKYTEEFFQNIMLNEKITFDNYSSGQPIFKKNPPDYALLSYCMGYSFSTGMLQILRAFIGVFTEDFYKPSILKKKNKKDNFIKKYSLNNKNKIYEILQSTSENTPVLQKNNVIGKTGSARIIKNKVYLKNTVNVFYMCSFVKNNKRYFMLIAMENPSKGGLASGTVKIIASNLINKLMSSNIN
jgi:cell division protein FtsI/penicillin-binding protein 2